MTLTTLILTNAALAATLLYALVLSFQQMNPQALEHELGHPTASTD